MAFFDQAQEMFAKGASAARGAVSDVAMEQLAFVRGFTRLCRDGWDQGWHERNGGNLTYRLRPEDVEAARPFFDKEPRPWEPLGVSLGDLVNDLTCDPTRDSTDASAGKPAAADLAGAFFLVTGAGRYMRNVADSPARNIGIVQLSDAGDAWRVVWGLTEGARPTSELPSHLLCHAVRARATGGASRVLYHAHPANVVAMTGVLPLDSRVFSRALWKTMSECVMVFPAGVGVVPWMVPGGSEIARATAGAMETFEAVIWANHGLFASGADFDATFGLMHTIEKAADIYVRTRSMNGGSDAFANTIPDDGLRQIAAAVGVTVNEAFLD